MFINCKLSVLMLVLILGGQVYAGKIFGGNEVVPHSRPYMVLLRKVMSDGSIGHCGGFLLSEDFVMTAAHCQAKSYTVLLGVHNVNNKNEKIQQIAVEQAFPHKDYNNSSYINDVMLLKMSSKATFNDNVKTITLASGDQGALPKSCRISGWGRKDRNIDNMSSKLREVGVTLINDEKCTKGNMYCSEGENGPGEGDSGGPLVCEDNKAYGVISATFRPSNGGPDVYRYAKIPDYRRWIGSTTRNALMKVKRM
ncbi:granzyme E-like [Stegastes partitus]|uniref:trypsin n=1 Tax=Stegastes partitus TaxID=144197 RepID=A0A9Y4NJV9_9TELE|nr:PREDICTED: granzyme E-like [Stegastes partitus]